MNLPPSTDVTALLLKQLQSQKNSDVVQAIRYITNLGKEQIMGVLDSQRPLRARLFHFLNQTEFELPDGSKPPPPKVEEATKDKKKSKKNEPVTPVVPEPYEWIKPIWTEILLFLQTCVRVVERGNNSLASKTWDPSWILHVSSLLSDFKSVLNEFLYHIVPAKFSLLKPEEYHLPPPDPAPTKKGTTPSSHSIGAPAPPTPNTKPGTNPLEKYTYQPNFQRSLAPNVIQLYDILMKLLGDWIESEAYRPLIEGWTEENVVPTSPFLKELSLIAPLCSSGVLPDLIRINIFTLRVIFQKCDPKSLPKHPAIDEAMNALQYFTMKQAHSPSQPLAIALSLLSLMSHARNFSPPPPILHSVIMSLSNALPQFVSSSLPSQALLTLSSRLFIMTSSGPIINTFQNFILFVSIFALTYANSLSLFFLHDKETLFNILTQFLYAHINFSAPIPGFGQQKAQNLPKPGSSISQMINRRNIPEKLVVPSLPLKPEEQGACGHWIRDFLLQLAPLSPIHFGEFLTVFITVSLQRQSPLDLTTFIPALSTHQMSSTPTIVNALALILLTTKNHNNSQTTLTTTLSSVNLLSQHCLALSLIPTIPKTSFSLFIPYVTDWFTSTNRRVAMDEAARTGKMGHSPTPPPIVPPLIHLSFAALLTLVSQAEKSTPGSATLKTVVSLLDRCRTLGWNFTGQMHLARFRTLLELFQSKDKVEQEIISHTNFSFKSLPSPTDITKRVQSITTGRDLSATVADITKATSSLATGHTLPPPPSSYPTTSKEKAKIFDSAFNSSQFRQSVAPPSFADHEHEQLLTSSTCSTPIDVTCRHAVIPDEGRLTLTVTLINSSPYSFSGIVIRALPSSPSIVLSASPLSAVRVIPFLAARGGYEAITFVFTPTAPLHDCSISFVVGVHSAAHTKEDAIKLYSQHCVDLNSTFSSAHDPHALPSENQDSQDKFLQQGVRTIRLPVPTVHFRTLSYRIPPQTFFVPVPLTPKGFISLYWTLPVGYSCSRCVCMDTRSFATALRRANFYSIKFQQPKMKLRRKDEDEDAEDEMISALFTRPLPAIILQRKLSATNTADEEEWEEEEEAEEEEWEEEDLGSQNVLFSRAFATTTWMQELFLCVVTGRAPRPKAPSSFLINGGTQFDDLSVPSPSTVPTNLRQSLIDTSFTLQNHPAIQTAPLLFSQTPLSDQLWTVRLVFRGRSEHALAEGLRLLESTGCFSSESRPSDLILN
ncbi:hypothetical protein BLNAU_13160 [Blattamonas nauphoetae]|uniref:Uncharacterized protein n=1 Tax=Blattamonas nauphoetae TaxID=2049346 RepID=A0ABQ9XHJ8_9EUKA|nr:hypothetical protein BLNAU_13160 [Blattamonas nauphoetae]